MHDQEFKTIIEQQRRFFASGETLSVPYRIEQLKKLKSLLQTHEEALTTALKQDLNKATQESLLNEILLVIREIDFIIKHLKKWARVKKVTTPLMLWPGKSALHYEPYGSVLIIGPWNYPLLLILSPLIGAMSAGNCAIVKPSEVAPNTQNILTQLINNHFSTHYIASVKGGVAEVSQLLQEKFDYIFFTGGTAIGKIVMEAAAKHLTPITLELGGKNPCIVDETADLHLAARRIAWAKTTNAGQVCLAPDYLYVHESRKTDLISRIINAWLEFYGPDAEKSNSYCRIINKNHFERLAKILQKGQIISGGVSNHDTCYISPTLIEGVSWDDPIMQEEIFGPILPILTYDNLDMVINHITSRPKPLALYLFTKNKEYEQKILKHISFGGGCINDCILHIANFHLPFGGVGKSGMGHYHGRYSFETFSHCKSIYKRQSPFEHRLEYPPYSNRKLWWIRHLMKL